MLSLTAKIVDTKSSHHYARVTSGLSAVAAAHCSSVNSIVLGASDLPRSLHAELSKYLISNLVPDSNHYVITRIYAGPPKVGGAYVALDTNQTYAYPLMIDAVRVLYPQDSEYYTYANRPDAVKHSVHAVGVSVRPMHVVEVPNEPPISVPLTQIPTIVGSAMDPFDNANVIGKGWMAIAGAEHATTSVVETRPLRVQQEFLVYNDPASSSANHQDLTSRIKYVGGPWGYTMLSVMQIDAKIPENTREPAKAIAKKPRTGEEIRTFMPGEVDQTMALQFQLYTIETRDSKVKGEKHPKFPLPVRYPLVLVLSVLELLYDLTKSNEEATIQQTRVYRQSLARLKKLQGEYEAAVAHGAHPQEVARIAAELEEARTMQGPTREMLQRGWYSDFLTEFSDGDFVHNLELEHVKRARERLYTYLMLSQDEDYAISCMEYLEPSFAVVRDPAFRADPTRWYPLVRFARDNPNSPEGKHWSALKFRVSIPGKPPLLPDLAYPAFASRYVLSRALLTIFGGFDEHILWISDHLASSLHGIHELTNNYLMVKVGHYPIPDEERMSQRTLETLSARIQATIITEFVTFLRRVRTRPGSYTFGELMSLFSSQITPEIHTGITKRKWGHRDEDKASVSASLGTATSRYTINSATDKIVNEIDPSAANLKVLTDHPTDEGFRCPARTPADTKKGGIHVGPAMMAHFSLSHRTSKLVPALKEAFQAPVKRRGDWKYRNIAPKLGVLEFGAPMEPSHWRLRINSTTVAWAPRPKGTQAELEGHYYGAWGEVTDGETLTEFGDWYMLVDYLVGEYLVKMKATNQLPYDVSITKSVSGINIRCVGGDMMTPCLRTKRYYVFNSGGFQDAEYRQMMQDYPELIESRKHLEEYIEYEAVPEWAREFITPFGWLGSSLPTCYERVLRELPPPGTEFDTGERSKVLQMAEFDWEGLVNEGHVVWLSAAEMEEVPNKPASDWGPQFSPHKYVWVTPTQTFSSQLNSTIGSCNRSMGPRAVYCAMMMEKKVGSPHPMNFTGNVPKALLGCNLVANVLKTPGQYAIGADGDSTEHYVRAAMGNLKNWQVEDSLTYGENSRRQGVGAYLYVQTLHHHLDPDKPEAYDPKTVYGDDTEEAHDNYLKEHPYLTEYPYGVLAIKVGERTTRDMHAVSVFNAETDKIYGGSSKRIPHYTEGVVREVRVILDPNTERVTVRIIIVSLYPLAPGRKLTDPSAHKHTASLIPPNSFMPREVYNTPTFNAAAEKFRGYHGSPQAHFEAMRKAIAARAPLPGASGLREATPPAPPRGTPLQRALVRVEAQGTDTMSGAMPAIGLVPPGLALEALETQDAGSSTTDWSTMAIGEKWEAPGTRTLEAIVGATGAPSRLTMGRTQRMLANTACANALETLIVDSDAPLIQPNSPEGEALAEELGIEIRRELVDARGNKIGTAGVGFYQVYPTAHASETKSQYSNSLNDRASTKDPGSGRPEKARKLGQNRVMQSIQEASVYPIDPKELINALVTKETANLKTYVVCLDCSRIGSARVVSGAQRRYGAHCEWCNSRVVYDEDGQVVETEGNARFGRTDIAQSAVQIMRYAEALRIGHKLTLVPYRGTKPLTYEAVPNVM